MSRISKFKRIYSEGVVNYSASEEMEESVKIRRGILRGSESQVSRTTGPGALTPDAAAQLGPKAVELQKTKAKQVNVPSFVKRVKKEEVEVKESLKTENPCWKGYKPVGVKMKKGRKVPNCVPEEFELGEAHMTASDVKQEEKLKKKYDPSGIKASMIKQYGPEKGKQVYFATIRKQAMKEYFELDEAPVQSDVEDEDTQNATRSQVTRQVSSTQNYLQQLAKRKKRQELIKKAREVSHSLEQQAMEDDYNYELDEAKISKTERRAKNAGKKGYDKKGRSIPTGKERVFDFDKVIANNTTQIHIKNPEGKRVQSLSDKQFYTHQHNNQLPKGHKYDFSDFNDPKQVNSNTPIKSTIAAMKRAQADNKPVSTLTARSSQVKGSVKNKEGTTYFLHRHGIDTKKVKQRFTGDMSPNLNSGEKKAVVLHHMVKKNPAGARFSDDHAGNLEAARKVPKVKTYLVKPNKRGEVMTRSYQATKSEEFELWVNALLDEGYDLSEFTIDELYEGYEELLDEASNIVATAAPGEGKPKRPTKSSYKKGIKYNSPYGKKEVKEEVVEVSPYEFWKSFIGEEEEVSDETIVEETEEVIERTPTSYDYWKAVITEQNQE